jgi:hypothetical protein
VFNNVDQSNLNRAVANIFPQGPRITKKYSQLAKDAIAYTVLCRL